VLAKNKTSVRLLLAVADAGPDVQAVQGDCPGVEADSSNAQNTFQNTF
jgi:hypothetical protein